MYPSQQRYTPLHRSPANEYPRTGNRGIQSRAHQAPRQQDYRQQTRSLNDDIEYYLSQHLNGLLELDDRMRPIGSDILARLERYLPELFSDAMFFYENVNNEAMGRENCAAQLSVMKNCAQEMSADRQLDEDFRIIHPEAYNSMFDALDLFMELTGNPPRVAGRQPRSLARGSAQPNVLRGGVDSSARSDMFIREPEPVLNTPDQDGIIKCGVGRRFTTTSKKPLTGETPNVVNRVGPADPDAPDAPRGQGIRRRRDSAPDRPSIEPLNPPKNEPEQVHLREPEIISQPFKDGDDEIFNMVAKQAQVTATEHVEQARRQEAQYAKDFSGVVETLGDHTEPLDVATLGLMTAEETDEVMERLRFNKVLGKMELYDRVKHRNLRYPAERPFPVSIDPLTHYKIVIVEDGVIHELIKERPGVELKDHIDDYETESTEGRQVDIAGIIRGVAVRVPTDENKKSVEADPENQIEAVMATADELAFPSKIVNTASSAMADISRTLLAKSLGTAIEGMNERRVTPFLVEPEFKAEIKALFDRIEMSMKFSVLHSIVEKFINDHPSEFSRALDQRLTGYFNNLLRFVFALPISVESFVGDYFDAYQEVLNTYGKTIGCERMDKEFLLFRKLVCASALEFTEYDTVLPAGLLGEGMQYVAFVDNIATVTLPFSSTDAEAMLPSVDVKTMAVCRSQTPTLVKLIENVSRVSANAYGRLPDQLRLVTNDNVVFYVYRGLFFNGDVYVVSRDNRATV